MVLNIANKRYLILILYLRLNPSQLKPNDHLVLLLPVKKPLRVLVLEVVPLEITEVLEGCFGRTSRGCRSPAFTSLSLSDLWHVGSYCCQIAINDLMKFFSLNK